MRGVGSLRPRRARCAGCLVTHVLLPVTVLLRRADAVEVIGAALMARAAGLGHRRIAAWLGVPAGTVRGWLRRWAARLEAVRVHFTVVARLAGVDLAVPKALGSPWRDVLAAVGAAAAAVTARFGPAGVIGPVTAWQVAAASSVVGFSHPVGRWVRWVPVPTRVAPDGGAGWSGIVARVIARQHLSGDPSDDEIGVSTVVNTFDEDAVKRRQRAQQVALFRYQLICPALEPGLSTKQRGKVVRGIAAPHP